MTAKFYTLCTFTFLLNYVRNNLLFINSAENRKFVLFSGAYTSENGRLSGAVFFIKKKKKKAGL